MFARISTLALFALSASAATILPRDCNTGSINCCSSVQNATSVLTPTLAGLLGIDLGSIIAQVGLTCSPLSVIGIGGTSCTAQPACCTGNTFGGLITLGCSPINLPL